MKLLRPGVFRVPTSAAFAFFAAVSLLSVGAAASADPEAPAPAAASQNASVSTPVSTTANPRFGKNNPFDVVAPDSPSGLALERLAREGLTARYPTSKDGKPQQITRVEAALMIAQAYDNVTSKLKNGNRESVSAADLSDLRNLYADFQPDLAALDKRVTALEQGQTDIKSQLASSFQLHPEFRVQPLTFTESIAGNTPSGTPLSNSTQIVRTGTASETVTLPGNDSGFMNYRLRFYLSGSPSENVHIAGRIAIENNTNPIKPFTGTSAQYPAVTSTTFDYGYVTYDFPRHSGFSISGGQLVFCCVLDFGTGTGFFLDSLAQGGVLKYVSPNKTFTAWIAQGSNGGYVFSTPGTYYYASYSGIPHLGFGIVGTNQANRTVTEFYNGALRTNVTTLPFIGGIMSLQLGPKFTAIGEVGSRMGTDPATGKAWVDPMAGHVVAGYGSLANPGNSQIQFEYATTGKNSLINNLSSYSFSDGPLGNLTNYVDNLRYYGLRFAYRFDKAGQLRLGWGLSNLGTPEFDANGNVLTKLNRNYFSLDTFFNF